MIVAYTPQPFGAAPRPLLDVQVAQAPFTVKALVDSGAVNTLLPAWVADQAGVALDGGDVRHLLVGGDAVDARFVTVSLAAAGQTWDADVGFTDTWQPGWGLLGHHAFFRYFTVTFRAADLEFVVEPITA